MTQRDPLTYAAGMPVPAPSPVVTMVPVTLDVPGRPARLELKVTAPATGRDLPIIVLSHGHGGSTFLASMYGYEPLTLFWAAHGFAVLQPSHLDSSYMGLREADDTDAPLYLHSRASDITAIIDRLEDVEASVPTLAGRLDRSKLAVVGHSAGGNTVGLVSGMSLTDDGTTTVEHDTRIGARVLLAPPGQGIDLATWAHEHYPVLAGTDFATMSAPALVVVGENDATELFSSREDWRSDAFTASSGAKTRLTIAGAEHMLGGISGFDADETSDESPERVALVRALIWAYLRSTLYPDDPAWSDHLMAAAEHWPQAVNVEDRHR